MLLIVGIKVFLDASESYAMYAIFNSTVAKKSHFFGARTSVVQLGHRFGSPDRQRTAYSLVSGT